MKNVKIITINGNNNFGNKLQVYALNYFISKKGINVKDVLFDSIKQSFKDFIKLLISYNSDIRRYNSFFKFSNKYIDKCFFSKNLDDKTNYYIVGSDQIWNPTFDNFNKFSLLPEISKEKRISYAASFGIDRLPENVEDMFKKELEVFKSISVREDRGKEIIEELTGRTDVEVLVDPTMLLTADEWDKVSKEPKQLKILEGKKYILNYFLGDLSQDRKTEIERIANENDCRIINIMDKNDPFFVSGPSEFLWLEKNTFLICTDSFHSSVFAILYNRPFIVFDREQKGIENMGSRLDTLINKFKLKNRRFEGKITKENLEHDYTEAYKILEEERIKSDKFLRKALDIEE